MNLNKSREYFDPETFDLPIHIIGCGAIGSTIAENLTRLGIKEITLWDFDHVASHNIANQMFLHKHIGMLKTDAVEEICKEINPEITINKEGKYTDEILGGILFICPDSIKVRRTILENNLGNPYIKAVFDGRMRMTDAQHFAAEWTTSEKKKALLNTMAFTDEEAKDSTPVSACGTTLSVQFNVRGIVSFMVANFIKYILTGKLHKMITIDYDTFILDAFLDK